MAATIKDIAKKTGLGLATISSYLNGGNVREQNRIKIEAAIEELHYEVNEVARGLKTNRTKLIGILIPELNNIFCAEIITEVEDILRNQGYATMICDCRTDINREIEAVEFLIKRRVDGVIVMPSGNKGKHFEKLTRAGIPVVLLDRKPDDFDGDCVLVDNQKGAKEAVNRLIDAGHRTIGMITGPSDVFTARERYLGYKEALQEANIPISNQLVSYNEYTIEGGMSGLRYLVENNKDMTAVFVANYELTMGVVIEASELNLNIPEELSVIGFDNVEFARACVPKLCIVSQPTKAIAQKVAEVMLERLECESKNEKMIVKLSTGFVEGKSIKRR